MSGAGFSVGSEFTTDTLGLMVDNPDLDGALTDEQTDAKMREEYAARLKAQENEKKHGLLSFFKK